MGFFGGVNFCAYANNSPTDTKDPTGLWVYNMTSNTIYVKPEKEDTAEPLASGKIYWKRHDGIAAPCDVQNAVYKSFDFIPIVVFPDGWVLPPSGGWLGEKWLEYLHSLRPADHGWDALFAASRHVTEGRRGRYGSPHAWSDGAAGAKRGW